MLAVPLLIFRLLLEASSASWPVVGLAIWSDTIWVLVSLAFWGMATHLFTLRQGKRLFGLLGAGLIFSEVISGLMIPVLVPLVGTVNLLLVAVAAVAGALVVQTYIVRSYAPKFDARDDEPVFFQEKAWWQLLRQPYIAFIFGLATLNLLAYFFIDNLFYAQAEQRYTDADALAQLIGTFFAVSGLITATIGAVISGRFFNRHGLQSGLLMLPAVLFAGVGLTIIAGFLPEAALLLFWLVLGIKLLNEVLKDSINEAAVLVLYQPLPVAQRLQVQTAVEGIIRPLAAGGAGLLLLLLGALFAMTDLHLEAGLLVLLLGWVALAVVLARKYPGVLMQALTRRKLDGAVLTLEDETSIATLEQALHNPHPGVALYALKMLRDNRPELVAGALPELLAHPAIDVRLEALRQIEQQKTTGAIPAVERCLNRDDALQVRAAAMRALVALDTIRALEQIYPHLDNPDPVLRQGAITCIIGYGTPELAVVAEGRLLQLVVSAAPTDRMTAAKILGAAPTRNLHHPLRQLLQDDDLPVKRAALTAAGQARYPQLWPLVVEAIIRPETRAPAAAALVAGGEAAVPAIRAAFEPPLLPQPALIRLVRVVERIGGPPAVALLWEQLDSRHEGLRTAVLSALARLGHQADPAQQARLMPQFDLEIGHAAWLLAALQDQESLTDAESEQPWHQFLHSVIHTQLHRTRSRIFYCLSFLYGGQMRQINDNLAANSAERRAYALEVLDTTLPPALKKTIMPLLEPLTPAQRLDRLHAAFPQERLAWPNRLMQLLRQPGPIDDPWLWACAAHTAGAMAAADVPLPPDLAGLVAARLQPAPADPLLTETAVWALNRLTVGQPDAFRRSPRPKAAPYAQPNPIGDNPMLSTLEKVIFLKSVNLFNDTPDEILAQLAMLLEEVEFSAGATIFEKGSPGDCMYIIISGQVEVFDDDHLLNQLGNGDVFGEMALLDSRARLASITVVTDTHLLRLDQEPFYELMEDHIAVARGVIFVLTGYLHDLLHSVSQLKSQSPSMYKL
ncbi:MAG: hypothetical protein Kow0031_30950 [Anaerolineae bacterium]